MADVTPLLEKLRQIAEAKPGDPTPECLRVADWARPLSALAGEAVAELTRLQAIEADILDITQGEGAKAVASAIKAALWDWQPIDTAPVEPWSPELACYYRFICLIQTARGDVSEGWAYWVPPPRSRPLQLPKMRWANRNGQCDPVAWIPMPAASSEYARSKP